MNQRRAEHDELRRIMIRFCTIMNNPGGPDHAELLRERMFFARYFDAHLAREQGEVAELSRRSADFAKKIKSRGEMIGQLRADYSEHIRRWTPAMVRAEWQAYRSAVLVLQRRLMNFMDWEERSLPLYA